MKARCLMSILIAGFFVVGLIQFAKETKEIERNKSEDQERISAFERVK